MDSAIHIRPAVSDADFNIARELFLAHEKALDEARCFHDFDSEMNDLAGTYAPPGGALLLAFEGAKTIGVIAMQDLGDGVCEMKRLYVVPQQRGRGIGRGLSEALLSVAKAVGHTTMRLETLERLEAAIGLYRDMGFAKDPTQTRTEGDTPIWVMVHTL